PTIELQPTSKVIADMVAVPIDEELRRADPLLPELLYVDARETKPDDEHASRGAINQNGERFISFNRATDWAWERGVRLTSASEYDAIVKAAQNHRLAYAASGRPAAMDDLFHGLAEWTTTNYDPR